MRLVAKQTKEVKAGEPGVKNPILLRERRAALVEAAIEVFFDRGYHACRVADVAEAAGLSQGSIYNYVKSKEDLLFLVCEDHLTRYRADITAALATASTPRVRLQTLLEATVAATFRYRKHYAVMMRELHHVEKTRRRVFMKLAVEQRQLCQDVLEQAGVQQEIGLTATRVAANLILFLPSFLAARGWDLRDRSIQPEIARILIQFMQRGIGMQPTTD